MFSPLCNHRLTAWPEPQIDVTVKKRSIISSLGTCEDIQ